jgi:hypothetical protein
MALPVQREIMKGLHQEVLHFLWTRQEDGEDLWQRQNLCHLQQGRAAGSSSI